MNHRTDRRVLVVDDSEDDRTFVRTALLSVDPDIQISEACDGVEALDYLRSDRPFPDLILLDLKMPRKDGMETLAEIRRDPDLRHVPVIAVFTTATDPEYVRLAYTTGANAYLGKPSTMASLREVMDAVVKHWFGVVTLPDGA